jgi:putative restriction endonuclease
MVSPRLRQEYGNGEDFYARARAQQAVAAPARRADRPNAEFLEWHADSVFLAS